MPFQLSRKITLLPGLLVIFIISIGYIAYIETQTNIPPTPTSSPTPTKNPNNSSPPLITNYSIVIPEIYHVGFGIAEIELKFIAPSPLQNRQTEANFSTTKLPIILYTTNSNLPAILNGTTIEIRVNVYQYTMITDNPKILAASREWNETKYVYT